MTGGVRVGPVVLDGADYGQRPCESISPEGLERMMADAHLIAAAPGLLRVCKDMLKTHAPTINGLCKICHHYGDDCEANKARAAVAKAEGGGRKL